MPSTSELSRLKRTFGGNLRRERHVKGITQEKLAELSDLSLRNIQRIEAGEINILMTTVVRLRKSLGCSSEKLIPNA